MESLSRMHRAEVMMRPKKNSYIVKIKEITTAPKTALATGDRLKQVGAENLRLYDFWISSLRVGKRTQRQWELNFSFLVQKLFSKNLNDKDKKQETIALM